MKAISEKTILFLNLRFADFYSRDLFEQVKSGGKIRLVAVLDQHFRDRVPAHLKSCLDKKYVLISGAKDGFLAEFDYAELKNIIREELQQTRDLRIVCADEFNLLNAGRLRREFRLAGHTEHELLPYRNKVQMKECLRKSRIRLPNFRLLHRSDDFLRLSEDVGLPFIIKPVDSSGSHGVSLIRSEDDFQTFRAASQHPGMMEAEEYIEGDLYHVDACIRDEEIRFIAASEYTCPNHDFTKGKVLGSIPLADSHPQKVRLINFAKKAFRALGANNLVCHMEIFVTRQDQDLVFLEVSARPPGALICLTHKINFGINLIDEDFSLQTGVNLPQSRRVSDKKAFWALFPLRPGRVLNLSQPPVKSQIDMTWHVNQGDYIRPRDCASVINKAAQAVFYHNDMTILREDFESLREHQALEVCA